jgi:hypothetical protein
MIILTNMDKRAKDIMPMLPGHDAQSIYDRRWKLKTRTIGQAENK